MARKIYLEESVSPMGVGHPPQFRCNLLSSKRGFPFASYRSAHVDEHFVLFKTNNGERYIDEKGRVRVEGMTSNIKETGVMEIPFGIAHTDQEARDKLYDRARAQAQKVAGNEGRELVEQRIATDTSDRSMRYAIPA